MPVEYFIRYKGSCYDVGTRLRFRALSYGYYEGIKEGIIDQFIGTTVFVRATDGKFYQFSTIRGVVDFDKIIREVTYPVYYVEKRSQMVARHRPSSWDIETGWIWYIIIMIVGTLFKDRLIVYVCATTYFFLWKNGFLNGGKK